LYSKGLAVKTRKWASTTEEPFDGHAHGLVGKEEIQTAEGCRTAMLLADAYELALISNDTNALTHLEAVVNSKILFMREALKTNQGVSSGCVKSAK
jgi:hypothetical protein